MTPQERAAALLELIDPFVPQYAWRDAEQKRTVKLELIANAIQATRRAALLEAAVVMRDGCEEPNCPQCTRIADELTRLAQEG